MDKKVKIVATGEKWVGKSVRATSSMVEELIDSTENSLLITIYILNDRNILKKIKESLERGIAVDLLVYAPDKDLYGIYSQISSLDKEYHHMNLFKVYDTVLHAKVLVSDRKKVLISSANLTLGGLLNNYELGVMIDDHDVAFEIESVIRRLFE